MSINYFTLDMEISRRLDLGHSAEVIRYATGATVQRIENIRIARHLSLPLVVSTGPTEDPPGPLHALFNRIHGANTVGGVGGHGAGNGYDCWMILSLFNPCYYMKHFNPMYYLGLIIGLVTPFINGMKNEVINGILSCVVISGILGVVGGLIKTENLGLFLLSIALFICSLIFATVKACRINTPIEEQTSAKFITNLLLWGGLDLLEDILMRACPSFINAKIMHFCLSFFITIRVTVTFFDTIGAGNFTRHIWGQLTTALEDIMRPRARPENI